MNASVNHMPPSMAYKKDAAAKADLDAKIDHTGKYVGAFTKVKFHTFPSNAAGYIFDFKSAEGQEARQMFICTINKTGEVNEIGENKVAAIMCCMGVQQATPQTATINEYDFKAGMDVPVQVYLYPEAMHKPIGLVLQKEWYTNQKGKDAFRMGMVIAFHAGSMRTAKEMIDGETQGSRVAEILEYLQDKDERQAPSAQNTNQSTNGQADMYGQGAPTANGAGPNPGVDFDDDIPF